MRIIYIIPIIVFCIWLSLKFKSLLGRKRNIKLFRDNIIQRNKTFQRFNERYFDKLLTCPDINIKICSSDTEESLIEKANIHRARLSKFGKSKMRGKIYYKGSRGGIYIYTKNGNKKYV